MPGMWTYALLSVFVISAVSLIGIAAISLSERHVRQTIFISVSLAAGAMFGDAFLHILPQSFAVPERAIATSTYVLTGLLSFFILEKFLRWRHTHEFEGAIQRRIEPVGYLNLFADATHNLIDGMTCRGILYGKSLSWVSNDNSYYSEALRSLVQLIALVAGLGLMYLLMLSG